jgi:phosphatidylglycerophosphate synthase
MTKTTKTGEQAELAPTEEANADFVLDLLAELRERHFRPRGWLRFFGRSWQRSQATATRHPRLVASWARVGGGLACAEVAALAIEARLGARGPARRAIAGTAVCYAAAQLDTYVHLGLHQPRRGEPLYPTLGGATALTLARRGIAGIFVGHLLGGRRLPRGLALALLAAASASDVVDGALARRRQRVSRLGAYLDGVADVELGAALTLTLAAERRLPRWLAALLLARWAGPLAFALASYFGAGSRVALDSTAIGKAAGVAQAVTLGAALMPATQGDMPPRARGALYVATAVLLVAAPLSQLLRVLGWRSRGAAAEWH